MAKTEQRRAFGAVSTGLMVGHGLVAVSALAAGLLILIMESPIRLNLNHLTRPLEIAIFCLPGLHVLLMLITPLWSWLAARTQTRVSRLWAWLGYLIPLASYWLPAQTLRRLAEGADPEAARRKTLILAWGVARGLAAPSFFVGLVLVMAKMGLNNTLSGWTVIIYLIVIMFAANLLSLLVISQMGRYLNRAVVDERHAEVFS